MARSFEETMRRARLRSAGVNPATGQPFDTDNTEKTNKNNNFRDIQPENVTDKTQKTYKHDYRGMYLAIHTDEDMLLAQSWRIYPSTLYNLCKQYGFQYVKSIIRRVAKIGDRYFREGEPIEPQRGRFTRAIILKEGQKIE